MNRLAHDILTSLHQHAGFVGIAGFILSGFLLLVLLLLSLEERTGFRIGRILFGGLLIAKLSVTETSPKTASFMPLFRSALVLVWLLVLVPECAVLPTQAQEQTRTLAPMLVQTQPQAPTQARVQTQTQTQVQPLARGSAKILGDSPKTISTGEFTQCFQDSAGRPTGSLTALTPEELEFIKRRLLPSYYPELKNRYTAARKAGLKKTAALKKTRQYAQSLFPHSCKSNFTADFGNPLRMLAWAREHGDIGSLEDLITSAKAGDVILSGPQAPDRQKSDMVCLLTNGPFHHVVLVIDGPPPVFIEAMGITAQWGDSRGDQVRYGTWYEFFEADDRIRLLRPTQGLPPTEARRLIDGAIAYATRQLGKPYDYGFSNADDQVNFYCSELVYKAWRDGAGLTGLFPKKSPQRDRLLIAFNDVLEAFVPKDRVKLNDRIVTFTLAFLETPQPDFGQVADFLVDELIPACQALEAVFPTPAAREQMRRMLKNLPTSGQSLFDLCSSLGTTAGQFEAWALIIFRLLPAVYHHLGSLAQVFPEPNQDSRVPFSPSRHGLRNLCAWVVYPGEVVRSWPLIGDTLAAFLPGGRQTLTSADFISPTDLADMGAVIKAYP